VSFHVAEFQFAKFQLPAESGFRIWLGLELELGSGIELFFTWRLDDPALSAFTLGLWIAQLCCLRSHSLELSSSGRSRFIFIIVIIMFLQPSQN